MCEIYPYKKRREVVASLLLFFKISNWPLNLRLNLYILYHKNLILTMITVSVDKLSTCRKNNVEKIRVFKNDNIFSIFPKGKSDNFFPFTILYVLLEKSEYV